MSQENVATARTLYPGAIDLVAAFADLELLQRFRGLIHPDFEAVFEARNIPMGPASIGETGQPTLHGFDALVRGRATSCAACGNPLPSRSGRGRPRRYCSTCLPPTSEIGKAELARRWRVLNSDRVASYNAERREVTSTVVCTVCASPFQRPSEARHEVCSHACALARRRARR